MPLAYYAMAAEPAFWDEHWGGHSVEEMLAVARRSPLTAIITAGLAPAAGGLVLEAGCGLGQYVILLRERGWRVAGVDWSARALRACRAVAPVPLAQMDLGTLALRDGAVGAYLSLGVVEHDAAGPDALVAEAARVLAPGGRLLLSVPYWNGARRLAAPWVRRRGRVLARRGARFYQYAFSRRELQDILARHGFETLAMRPYDPARLFRRWMPRRARSGDGDPRGAPPGSGRPAGRPGASPRAHPAAAGPRSAARALLYSRPLLAMFGHMILVVATRR